MNKHAGSSFDSFLEEEGILEECEKEAQKRVAVFKAEKDSPKSDNKPAKS